MQWLLIVLTLLLSPVSGFSYEKPKPPSFEQRMEEAIQLLKGAKYVWGGEDFSGADCSGAMYLLFKYAGKPFPRMTSRKMYSIFGLTPTIHWSKVEKYYFYWWTITPNRPYGHVGLANGDGKSFWQAGVKSGFSKREFRNGNYWDRYYAGYGRR